MMAIHDLVSAMTSKKQVDTLTLDFSTAFDRAPHQRLLYKLSHYGIQRNLLPWIQVFLTKRTQSVAANEHQGSMKYQENRDRRKMPTKSREYITGIQL